MRLLAGIALAAAFALLGACGGGGGGSSSLTGVSASSTSSGSSSSGSTTSSSSSGGGNTLSVAVDAGPAALQQQNYISTNMLYATVTICTPGSSSACQSIDHIQIDTGSTGLRIFSSVLSGAASAAALNDPSSGDRLFECVQFADGYTWGSMATADVKIGARTLASVVINLMADPAAGSAPRSCSSGLQSENDVVSFGANGILGIGNYLQDCGSGCAPPAAAPAGFYYLCPSGNCQPVSVALSDQAQNVVSLMSTDNNGVVISLPSESSPGAVSLNGTLYFGIGTQSDNVLPGSATMLELNAGGEFTTVFGGTTMSASFIDSGSTGYFFPDSNITTCPSTGSQTSGELYCPPSPVTGLNGTFQDNAGHTTSAGFSIDNANTDFDDYPSYTVLTNLGGTAPNSSITGGASFDWGLPFFYGRPVYVLFEQTSLSGVSGPATGF